MKFAPVLLLSAGSMASTIHSNGQELSDMIVGAIQAEWSGSPIGIISLQVSNDNVPISPTIGGDPAANVVNWSDYTNSATAVSGAGNFMWNMTLMGFKWARVIYTRTSGTGSLTVEFMGKG